MFHFVVLDRANRDVIEIFGWLFRRSIQGAYAWYDAYEAALRRLQVDPERCPFLQGKKHRGVDLHHLNFHTSQGRKYFLVFLIDRTQLVVKVLRVRGPGQRPIRRRDLK